MTAPIISREASSPPHSAGAPNESPSRLASFPLARRPGPCSLPPCAPHVAAPPHAAAPLLALPCTIIRQQSQMSCFHCYAPQQAPPPTATRPCDRYIASPSGLVRVRPVQAALWSRAVGSEASLIQIPRLVAGDAASGHTVFCIIKFGGSCLTIRHLRFMAWVSNSIQWVPRRTGTAGLTRSASVWNLFSIWVSSDVKHPSLSPTLLAR